MNEQIESIFVNTFIQKQYRERLLFDLKDVASKSQRRQRNAFSKFAHSAEGYLVEKCIAVANSKLTQQDVLSFIQKWGSDITCYYMDEHDGEEMPIDTAVETAFDYLGPSIIVYKNIFAVIKEETSIGAPNKIILVNPF